MRVNVPVKAVKRLIRGLFGSFGANKVRISWAGLSILGGLRKRLRYFEFLQFYARRLHFAGSKTVHVAKQPLGSGMGGHTNLTKTNEQGGDSC